MREELRFYLGDEPVRLSSVDPCMTVLDWLRRIEHRVGSKEGCNEGDCGACTVVVGRVESGAIRWRAVNSCIQLIGQLDGCQLLTVEDMKSPDGRLHPIQQALVECHGSQCGFCTPGFVMSMEALALEQPTCPDPQRIDDALAGNLCRCTGYAPIVRSVVRSYELGAAEDRWKAREGEILARLLTLQDQEVMKVGQDGRSFWAPATLDDLARLCAAHPRATILAGATDVGLWVTKQMRQLDPVIWIGRVAELRTIRETADTIEIGAGVSHADAMPLLAKHYPDMGEMWRRFGSTQVRNSGTVGGGIANGSPIGDGSPALIAAGATLHLRFGDERRSLPLEAFFVAYGKQDRRPGEIVERISVPKPAPGGRYRCYKITKRFDQDISAVLAAFSIRVEAGRVTEARLAYGGMAATPKRASAAEAAMLGQPWSKATADAAMEALGSDFTPLTDMRASAGYRLRVARNLIMRLHVETTRPDVATRLVGDRSLAHV